MGYSPGWQLADVMIAQGIIAQHSDLKLAIAAVKIELRRECHPSTLRRAFKKHGLNPPAWYLKRGPARVGEDVKVEFVLSENDTLFPRMTPRAAPAGDVKIQPIEALVERYGGAAETRYIRSLERKVGQRDYLAQRLESSLLAAFRQCPVKASPCFVKPREVPGRRLITALVSDVHFGLDVDSREVPAGGYSWNIAARRLARLAVETAAWKQNHRDETDLQIVLAGDILCGLIHTDDAGIRPLTEQIHGAFSILFGYINYLSQHFARVRVSCLPGNHDRVKVLRQVAQRWDSHAHAVYLALAAAFRNEPRVSFDVPLAGEALVELPGGKSLALFTHGDVRPTISNVGRALSIAPIVAALNRVNASGEYPKPIRVIAWGHYHQGFVLPTGLGTAIVNGSVIGPDSFARNGCGIRGSEGEPMQLIFESVPGHEFGDSRWLSLRCADNDASLDAVIATPSIDQWVAA